MKKLSWLLLSTILGALLLSACAGPSPGAGPVTAVEKAAPAPKAGWEQKWDTVLAEAKKEGVVAVYALWGPEPRNALTQAFTAKYGINLEFSLFSRGADLVAKVQAENRASLSLADVFGGGNTTLLVNMKPEGVLGPIPPLLILPEVLDANAYRRGRIPLTDEDGTALSLIEGNIRYVVYNSNLIKEGEITSYKDLLKPQYKGKITFNDPTVSGSGNGFLTHIWQLWGEAEAIDFFRRLIKEQEVVIVRDNRIHVESVARGKYAIALATFADTTQEFIALGAPLKKAIIEEDIRVTASAGALGVPTRFAHPNATTVFVNWLLTKEGNSVFVKSYGQPGVRVDATTENVDPLAILVPGKKYEGETEKFLGARGRWMELAKKIMEETAK